MSNVRFFTRRSLFLLFLFTAYATSVAAESLCDSAADIGSKIACFALAGAGAVTVTASELSSALLSGTDVRVRLSGGSIQPAKLTRKGASGRVIDTNDILDLDCTVNEKPYAGDYGYAHCNLKFPKRTPKPKSPDYYERIGEQPSWGFGANAEGIPEPSIIKLSHPIVWKQQNHTATTGQTQ